MGWGWIGLQIKDAFVDSRTMEVVGITCTGCLIKSPLVSKASRGHGKGFFNIHIWKRLNEGSFD